MLKPNKIPEIPILTKQVAHASFPKGNIYITLKDELGIIYENEFFADLFPAKGQPAADPWRLAMITVMQFIEGLSDRQAVEAMASRIDWKYLLSLELTATGYDNSVLCEFRSRLIKGAPVTLLLDRLLKKCEERKWIKKRGTIRTDSTHMLGAIRATNRLVCIGETIRAALNSLATVAPDWMRQHAIPDWTKRYSSRIGSTRLPQSQLKQLGFAIQIGKDGYDLLDIIYQQDDEGWLRNLPAVKLLRNVWVQQFYLQEDKINYRDKQLGIPPALQFISSPYDKDARYAKKYTTSWIGYKVHITETCQEDLPYLITHMVTTKSPIADSNMTDGIHDDLKKDKRLPKTHLVDTGYIDSALLVNSKKQYAVELLGPTRSDQKWQARSGKGFALKNFKVDLDKQEAICPEGHTSKSWTIAYDKRKKEMIKVKFSMKDCKVCKSKAFCTKAQRRTLTLLPKEEYQAMIKARIGQSRGDYITTYNRRAGVEATISLGVRAFGMRRSRYIGLCKANLQNVIIATAMNFSRIYYWLEERPRERTRISAFRKLMEYPDRIVA
ncbi:IS1182 family transposase (plasmid) [Chondrinema litorale]|nr:IS1182 family transposase [Chondrinema litorale]UZR94205.1 IS1182 family transposase [Chondrinema litorale]UZR95484.1 IS1182 family transposase [Chondrinema litorale]UZR96279.1 IS1182 family transposase [Chondrinema litorale]UZR96799.1 IS1182 family transposase [Chondrinema litorale]UZR97395.1 IS1182 family transposase [Chondrinema litorale]